MIPKLMTHFNPLLGGQPQKSDLVGVVCNLDTKKKSLIVFKAARTAQHARS